jgi:hypothetical protein
MAGSVIAPLTQHPSVVDHIQPSARFTSSHGPERAGPSRQGLPGRVIEELVADGTVAAAQVNQPA